MINNTEAGPGMSTVLRGKSWGGRKMELVIWLGRWEILCSGGRW